MFYILKINNDLHIFLFFEYLKDANFKNDFLNFDVNSLKSFQIFFYFKKLLKIKDKILVIFYYHQLKFSSVSYNENEKF